MPYLGDQDSVTREIERFAAFVRDEEAVLDRVLATVLFTDIVGSTERARGSATSWRTCWIGITRSCARCSARYRGARWTRPGDGFFATFDGPARAVRCAQRDRRRGAAVGIEFRAGAAYRRGRDGTRSRRTRGCHRGPGRRRLDRRGAGLPTVKDLIAGCGIGFEDRGEHELKGVPDRWHLYRVLVLTAD